MLSEDLRTDNTKADKEEIGKFEHSVYYRYLTKFGTCAIILSKTKFVPVGDAGIKLDLENTWFTEDGQCHVIFYIKAQ